MVQLQILLSLTFETMGEIIHFHLKGIFQKQISSYWQGLENAIFFKIGHVVKLPKILRTHKLESVEV